MIAAGGGAFRCTDTPLGLEGRCVVDKDLAAAVLGCEIGASTLLILTDVDAVYRDYGTERAKIGHVAKKPSSYWTQRARKGQYAAQGGSGVSFLTAAAAGIDCKLDRGWPHYGQGGNRDQKSDDMNIHEYQAKESFGAWVPVPPGASRRRGRGREDRAGSARA